MIYYCISDIHGCLSAFNNALNVVIEHLEEENTALILLGDYIHGGEDSYGVLDRIIELQRKYGNNKVIALLGNHDEYVCDGFGSIDENGNESKKYDEYINWMCNLPRYYVDEKTIFVHAGIDEEAEDMWEYGTSDFVFTEKFPPETGHFYEDYKIVAGHVYTSEVSGNPNFNGIYYDGESHYYIDSDVLSNGFLNILKVDTETQEYFEVTENGDFSVLPYDKED